MSAVPSGLRITIGSGPFVLSECPGVREHAPFRGKLRRLSDRRNRRERNSMIASDITKDRIGLDRADFYMERIRELHKDI